MLLRFSFNCLIYICISWPDTWKHIGAAEEVEVHPVLSSGYRAGGAREGPDEHSLRRDQTGPSSAQDCPYAHGGSLCLCPVLPADQRAQCHEKVSLQPPAATRFKWHGGELGCKCCITLSCMSLFCLSPVYRWIVQYRGWKCCSLSAVLNTTAV